MTIFARGGTIGEKQLSVDVEKIFWSFPDLLSIDLLTDAEFQTVEILMDALIKLEYADVKNYEAQFGTVPNRNAFKLLI